ncbi:MAG: hypothetical protein SOW84_03085 [Candidatus Faecousia sp.]|nr:hypothetical protein [Candidatus Faecousia sp.]
MTEKIRDCWKSLDRRIVVNQRELVLGLAVCALAGIVVGALFTPRKNVSIGSNNGNNAGNVVAHPSDADKEEDEE